MPRLKGNPGIWIEWGLWVGLALIAYNITYVFDKPLESYRYGATGWPRFVLISIMVGATAQLIFRFFEWEQSAVSDEEASDSQGVSVVWPPNPRMLAIFLLPLLYLWLLPRTGFYLTTPVFIGAYMMVLGVHRWKPIVAVTATVYGLVLLIFTRLFYVALPVGNWQPFYDINNAIIVSVRAGL